MDLRDWSQNTDGFEGLEPEPGRPEGCGLCPGKSRLISSLSKRLLLPNSSAAGRGGNFGAANSVTGGGARPPRGRCFNESLN